MGQSVNIGLTRIVLAIALIASLSGCASKFRSYEGPEVTRVIVLKTERRLYLLHHSQVLTSYEIDLGFDSAGDKNFEGDGRTPEGSYIIDRRNPNSAFHLSLGISYPNRADREFASSMGLHPGGDIFIHGSSRRGRNGAGPDWTAGCISVSNAEIEEIYAMVRDGTPIHIYP